MLLNDGKSEVSPPQLDYGMKAIAEFYQMPVRRAFHLAAKGHLPGVFRLGGRWALEREIAREDIRKAARRIDG